jgi:hypothetical protein
LDEQQQSMTCGQSGRSYAVFAEASGRRDEAQDHSTGLRSESDHEALRRSFFLFVIVGVPWLLSTVPLEKHQKR